MTDLIGFHAVRECLRESPAKARCLYIVKSRRDARIEELILLAKDRKVRYQMIESSWMKRRGITGTHQNVLLDCHEIAIESEVQLKAKWMSFPSHI